MKRRLPVGIQDFVSIREDGYCYVDKTARIHELITSSGKAFFLSRPRRFGKSLLCSTLGAIFEGRRELFGEIAGQAALAIDSLEWEWKHYPVIRLDLNPGDYTHGEKTLYSNLRSDLVWVAKKNGITLAEDAPPAIFRDLIRTLAEKTGEKVVVIIDEYDKPLLNTIDTPDIHLQLRNALKGFYGVLKSCDAYCLPNRRNQV